MTTTFKSLLSTLVIALVVLVAAPSADAASIRLQSGASVVTINDAGGNDLSGDPGVVAFVGSVGAFQFNITFGVTKPTLGTSGDPEMAMYISANSFIASATPATLNVWFSETGFSTPLGLGTAVAEGGASGALTYSTYQGNALFNEGTLITSDTTAGGPFVFADTGFVPGGASYALTQKVTITHGVGFNSSNFIGSFSVPDGGFALSLLGFGLIGIEGLRRRFTRF